MDDAVLYGMPDRAYRELDGLSYTESKLLLKSPAHFKWARTHPEVWTPSSNLVFGSMVHCATLEPSSFDHRYTMGPSVSKATKEWKQFAEFCALQGTVPCMVEDREAAFACAASVKAHPEVAPLMAEGEPEVSFVWTDRVTGITRKGRIDWVHQAQRRAWVLDLKTTEDASRQAFTRSVVNYQYHRQADWYETGFAQASELDVSPMLFVVVEKVPPYACATYTLDRWFMAQAKKTNAALCALYKQCEEMDEWPGYDTSITDLVAPRFALDEEMRELQREEDMA